MVYRRSFSRLAVVALAALFTSTLLAASCAGPEALSPDEPVASVSQRLDPEHPWTEQQKIQANDTLPYTYFGCAVAIDGDQALIGGYRADSDRGAGYVFAWNNERKKWIQEARLTAPHGAVNDQMGNLVAISGDLAVVGAPNREKVYVFERLKGAWVFTQELVKSSLSSVAVTRDRIFVAGTGLSINIYLRGANNTWEKKETIGIPKDLAAGNLFGSALAVEGDKLAVGALGSSGSGEVRVFKYDGATWTQEGAIIPMDSAPASNFGTSIALSGTTIAVGAPKLQGLSKDAGAVFVFTYDGSAWSQQAILSDEGVGMKPSDYRRLGSVVALFKDTLVAGRLFSYGSPDSGNYDLWQFTDNYAYRFERTDGTWSPAVRFKGHDTPAPPVDRSIPNAGIFGNGIAISERWLIVGDPESDTYFGDPTKNMEATDDPGAAYVFTVRGQPCAKDADCATGYCVDGVCCENACNEPCHACSAAKKGDGVDGVCGAVKDHTDPEKECEGLVCAREARADADAGTALDAGAPCVGERCFTAACLRTCSTSADCLVGYCDPATHKCATIDPTIEFQQGCGCRTAPGSAKAPPGFAAAGLLAALCLAARQARRRASPRARAHARAARRGGAALVVSLGALGCSVDVGETGRPEALGVGSSRLSPDAIAFEEHAQIVASAIIPDNQFGAAIAADGDTIVVGAPAIPDKAGVKRAYAYKLIGDAWKESAMNADMAADPSFGQAVAISGDVIAVGAPHEAVGATPDAGVVRIFHRGADGAWTAEQTLDAGINASPADLFGAALAIEGNMLAIGAPAPGSATAPHSGVGQVYIFTRDDTGRWSQQDTLVKSDAFAKLDDQFGAALAISGDLLAVGAPNADLPSSNMGAVHVFLRKDDAWAYEKTLTAMNGAQEDHLGTRVAADGARVAAVTPEGANQGVVTIFERDGNTSDFSETSLDAGAAIKGDGFGSSITLSGDTLLVGAPSALGITQESGAAYVFMWGGKNWERSLIPVQNGRTGDRLGAAVALAGTGALLGAPAHPVQRPGIADSVGAVYQVLLGTLPSCSEGNQSVAGMAPGQTTEPLVSDCRSYRCNPDTGACRTECTETSQCITGNFCDSGKCVPLPGKALGQEGCVASVARGGDGPSSLAWGSWGLLGLIALLRARGRRRARVGR